MYSSPDTPTGTGPSSASRTIQVGAGDRPEVHQVARAHRVGDGDTHRRLRRPVQVVHRPARCPPRRRAADRWPRRRRRYGSASSNVPGSRVASTVGVSPTSVMPCPLMKSCSTSLPSASLWSVHQGAAGHRRHHVLEIPTREARRRKAQHPRPSGTSARRTSSVPRFSRPSGDRDALWAFRVEPEV